MYWGMQASENLFGCESSQPTLENFFRRNRKIYGAFSKNLLHFGKFVLE